MMTKFNPENKETITYVECLDPAMGITDPADARQYFDAYCKYISTYLKNGVRESGKTAQEIARVNLGYFAGYYSNETRENVERLFSCSRPVFGNITDGIPSPE